jgi:hypothetical protein
MRIQLTNITANAQRIFDNSNNMNITFIDFIYNTEKYSAALSIVFSFVAYVISGVLLYQ